MRFNVLGYFCCIRYRNAGKFPPSVLSMRLSLTSASFLSGEPMLVS